MLLDQTTQQHYSCKALKQHFCDTAMNINTSTVTLEDIIFLSVSVFNKSMLSVSSCTCVKNCRKLYNKGFDSKAWLNKSFCTPHVCRLLDT